MQSLGGRNSFRREVLQSAELSLDTVRQVHLDYKEKIKGTQVLHSLASRVQISLSSNLSSSALLYGVQKIYIPRTH